jgi:mannose-6-phosphate isomerase-like protein (cupin superfamily)
MSINIALEGYLSESILIQPTIKDIKLVENLRVRKLKHSNSEGFRNVIVPKPWGLEYLCGRNKYLEVWELYIDSGASTSLHCHPDKDTLNIILEGEATLETIKGKEVLYVGDFRIIKAGAIHRTINHSESCARVLEIESPPNKYNLIRVRDSYGRENLGYIISSGQEFSQENKDSISLNHCLDPGMKNYSEEFFIRDFIPICLKENGGKSILIREIIFNGITFESEKTRLIKYFSEQSVKNLIVADGSVVIAEDDTCRKLLPGECIHNISLEEFNWSSTQSRILVW